MASCVLHGRPSVILRRCVTYALRMPSGKVHRERTSKCRLVLNHKSAKKQKTADEADGMVVPGAAS